MVVKDFDYVGVGIFGKGDQEGRVRTSLAGRSLRQKLWLSWSYWPIESR